MSQNDPQTNIGVIIEHDNTRIYVSGYTEPISEMTGLRNIDVAVIALAEGINAGEMTIAAAEMSPKLLITHAYGNHMKSCADSKQG